MSIEKHLINHCSSTLASLKTGNMFNIPYESDEELIEHLAEWNCILNKKGVYVTILRTSSEKALIYVYRKSSLEKELERDETRAFLEDYGYDSWEIEYVLDVLRSHFIREDCPHEVGVFLGYPLPDVVGFIENGGKNYKCSGCWKVYCDVQASEKMSCKFKKCKKIYTDLWSNGRSICRLTVAG